MDKAKPEDPQALAAALAEADRLRALLAEARADGALREALLRRAVDPGSMTLTETGGLAEEDALLQPLEARYGFLFRREERTPTEAVAPPVSGAPALTREDVRRMSADEINRNWDAVRDALMG